MKIVKMVKMVWACGWGVGWVPPVKIVKMVKIVRIVKGLWLLRGVCTTVKIVKIV